MFTLRSTISFITIGISLLASGCTVASAEVDNQATTKAEPNAPSADEDGTAETPPPSPDDDDTSGIISGNGAHALTPEILALFTPLAKVLALDALSIDLLQKSQLLSTLDGRTFLDYVVKCALPAGDSLTLNILGSEHTFPGFIGLAPEWKSGPLKSENSRWLTACLLAHVNATTAHVSIVLRGAHPALSAPLSDEGKAYTLREGAFYGDLFHLADGGKFACSGDGSVPLRKCTEDVAGLSPCGFVVPGACLGPEGACESAVEGAYEGCSGGELSAATPSYTYDETITVYLVPEDASTK